MRIPPFSINKKILKKVKQEQDDGILIAPVFTTQAWFPVL